MMELLFIVVTVWIAGYMMCVIMEKLLKVKR